MNTASLTSGIHFDLSFPDYLNHPGYGNSDLREFRNGLPALMAWKRKHRDENGRTDATRIGTAAHCAILTPDLFASQIAVKPEGMTFQSNANKAIKQQWESEGRTIISYADSQKIEAIRSAFFAKRAAAEAYANAVAREATVFWRDLSGVQRKCRPDWFTDECIYDLKVSVEATKTLDQLVWSAKRNGWLNQLAGGRAGLNANGHDIKCGRLVVIAPTPPQELRVWLLELSAEDCDYLEFENEETCKGIAIAERDNFWPSTPEQFVRISLPVSSSWSDDNIDDDASDDDEGEFSL